MQQDIYRPTAITVVSLYLMISGGFGLVSPLFLLMYESSGASGTVADVSPWILAVINVAGGVANLAAGKAIWDRLSWGRTLYAIATPLMLLPGFFLLGNMGLPSAIGGFLFYTIIIYMLSRPVVNDYFDGLLTERPVHEKEIADYRRQMGSPSDIMRLFGAICLGISTFFLMILIMMAVLSFGLGSPLTVVSVMGIPFLILLGLGINLWGIDRWPASLGWVLLVAGVFSAFMGVSGWISPQTEMWQEIAPEIDPAFFASFKFVAFAGVIIAIAGAGMIRHMFEADRAAVRESTGV